MTRYKKSVRNRRDKAFSIMEMLVSVSVVGIAIAGITEMTWLNASAIQHSLNQVDNLYSSRIFLDSITRDIRQSTAVSPASTNQTLILTVPCKMVGTTWTSDTDLDANGFPKSSSLITITYNVKQDPDSSLPSGYYIVTETRGSNAEITVLRGLVGPMLVAGSAPAVFQYVDRNILLNTDPTCGVNNTATNDTNTVLINAELRRFDFGGKTRTEAAGKNAPSTVGFRTEVFLRGNLGLQ